MAKEHEETPGLTPPSPTPSPRTHDSLSPPSSPTFAEDMHNISKSNFFTTNNRGTELDERSITISTTPPTSPLRPSPLSPSLTPLNPSDTTTPPPSSSATPDGRHWYYRWIVLFISTISILLASIQQNALIVAFPAVIDGIGADFKAMVWVLLAFSMLIASMTIAQGGLSDMIGRCRIFNIGFLIFVIGSLLGGFAQRGHNGWDLVGYRLIQAYGGTALFSNSGAILTDAFFPYKQVGMAMGVNQVASAFGSILGPLLGGVMSDIWRWIFFMNVPIGGVAFVLSVIYIKDKPRKEMESLTYKQQWKYIGNELYHKFDWIGAFFSFAWVASFLLALTDVSAVPTFTPKAGIPLFPIAAVFLLVFILNEKFFVNWWKNKKRPLVHLALFSDRIFVLALIGNILAVTSRAMVLLLAILFLQGPYSKDPYMAGIQTIPLGIGLLIAGLTAGVLSDKFGRKLLQVFGPLVAAAGTLGLALAKSSTSYWLFAFGLVVTGAGHGLYNSPNGAAIMLKLLIHQCRVPAASRGVASGIRMFMTVLGMSLGLIISFAIVLELISIDELLPLFLYGTRDPSKLPAGYNIHETNRTLVHTLSIGFWVAFALVTCASICSLFLPGKFVVRNTYATNEVTSTPKGDK